MIDYEKIGQRILEQRKYLRKISQEKMAEDLGMYQADISNLEKAKNGSGITDLSKLDVIADYFDIPLERLLFGLGKEENMEKYLGNTMEIRENDEAHRIKKEHEKTLEKLAGHNPWEIALTSFDCGPYTVYAMVENQVELGEGNTMEERMENGFILDKFHFYTFYENEVIASMMAPAIHVIQLVHEPTLATIQEMIRPDVLDAFDCLRTLNPYVPMVYFPESEEEEEKSRKKLYERMDQLREYAEAPVLFIEGAYVREGCREKGMFRLLIDVLSHIFGDYTAWLNLEPSGDNLDTEYEMFPICTQAEVGQMSINAAIAEKLGFTVDPDTWHREVDVIKADGTVESEVVLVRKCAYKIAEYIKPIIANDGDLVEQGRARQKVAQSNKS